MPPAAGQGLLRFAAMIPVLLLILFVGILWLLGLACGPARRRYVTTLSAQAMTVVGRLIHASSDPDRTVSSPSPRSSCTAHADGALASAGAVDAYPGSRAGLRNSQSGIMMEIYTRYSPL